MLVPVVFVLALLAALTASVLDTALTRAQVAGRAAIARIADTALDAGVASFTAGLADAVRRDGMPGSWSPAVPPSTAQRVCSDDAARDCPYTATVGVRITGYSVAAGSTPSDPIRNRQSAVIDEQRLSAVVTATVATSAGAVVGTRARLLTYRLVDAEPYAVVAGERDAAAQGVVRSAGPGDAGGLTGEANGDAAPAPGDTRIHLRLVCRTVIADPVPYVNDQQPAGNDGLPWGVGPNHNAHEAGCGKLPAQPADNFGDATWRNGDVPAASAP